MTDHASIFQPESRYAGMFEVSPLHLAALNPDSKVSTLLLEHGSPIDTRISTSNPWLGGWSALHFAAAYNGEPKVAEVLLEWGADINYAGIGSTMTPISVAIYPDANPQMVELLLDWGADAEIWSGAQPLAFMAARSNFAILEMLIDRSGGVPPFSGRRYTIIHSAAGNPDPRAVDLFLDLFLDQGLDVNTPNQNGNTALHVAVQMNSNPEVAARLLGRGADISAKGARGESVLHRAVSNPNLEMAAFILDQGVDIEARDGEGRTPLFSAVGHRLLPTIELLLDRGANIGSRDNSGNTPLLSAFRYRTDRGLRYTTPDESLLSVLLEKGADIDASDDAGASPLLLAAGSEDWTTVRLLAELGADIDKRDSAGNTVLHLAVLSENRDTVEWLLEMGVDRGIANTAGKTACQVARDEGNFTGTPVIGQLCRP